ncbi:phytoene/squalene synthase family protein [Flagellimonas taeanensis]|uniref:phytoene/squalene synthase family protein n=1 Tax=Flavobacteriaceae TaxID=49546 RepID=UPI000E688DD6|nr:MULTISPECIES: phytoene/squalene synthase family protein [Allomuricauda]MDC6386721.1 phytoene/squalene synthase family protein [Muricauda sp. SK9]RIV49978.1 phytoene/squalene synthase family protein [Allomuricauda taeanensis]
MKTIFDDVSYQCSKIVTRSYSTSFALATKMLAPSIRSDIYNIYGFVRFADEIVDTFHDYDKEKLFHAFEKDMEEALQNRISLNPILNSFQHTYHKYDIPHHLVESFMESMRMDLTKKTYETFDEYRKYIYGSADVVGLMCLCVFVNGDKEKYKELKESAMALGSAFQKVNFLRDLKADYEDLNRTYFPNTNLLELDEQSKKRIVNEIKADFALGYSGITKLPEQAKFGVYTAYRYYKKLLQKLQGTPPLEIKNSRIRVPNYQKFGLLAHSYLNYKLQMVQ